MSIFKNSIALGIVALMMSAYFYPSDEIINSHKNTDPLHTPPSSTIKNLSVQNTHLISSTEVTKQQLVPLKNKVLDIAYNFQSTEDYEAASIYGPLPANLADLTIEKFSYDANGQLIINENIKHIIEFFLMTAQEEGRDQAIARLNEYINQTLPIDAAAQALEIAQSYLSYKSNLLEYDFSVAGDLSDDKTITKVKAALEAKKALRRTHLGEALSESMFGSEERYDTYSVTRVEINANNSLSNEEKNRRLAQAENNLSPEAAQRMRHDREEKILKTKIATLQKSNDTKQEVYTLRKDFYGEKVANRMTYLEDNSGDWRDKVTQFEHEKQSIQAQNHLNANEKKQLVQESKQSIFSDKERIKYAVQSIRGQIAQVN
jgi:lipase chaperone LimK